MATSGEQIFTGVGSWKQYRFTWYRSSYNLDKNETKIFWSLKATLSGSAGYVLYNIYIDDSYTYGSLAASKNYTEREVTIKYGYATIKHNDDGSGSFSMSFDSGVSEVGSGSATFELDPLYVKAELLTVPETITDEAAIKITYTVPASNDIKLQVCVGINSDTDGTPYRAISKNENGASTVSVDRTALRQAVKNGDSLSVRVYLKTIGEREETTYLPTTLKLVHHEPTLSPTVEDINTRTLTLTGDKNTMVKYYSTAYFDTGARARKEATIEYHTITNGEQVLDDYVDTTGTIEGVTSNTFYFSVTDSRGITTRDAVVKTLIPYVRLTASVSTGIMSANGDITFTVKGKYFKGEFGAQPNTLELEFALRDKDGNYFHDTATDDSGWARLGFIDDNQVGGWSYDEVTNNYEFSYTVRGLNYSSKYELTVNLIDELSPVQSVTTILQAVSIFDWNSEDFRFRIPVYLNRSDVPLEELADYVLEQGESGSWFYRKWYSGKVDLIGEQSISYEPCNIALGGWYRTAVQSAPAFPFVVLNPQITASYESDGYGALIWATTQSTNSAPFDYYLIRPTSSSGITGKIVFNVTGEWKGVL